MSDQNNIPAWVAFFKARNGVEYSLRVQELSPVLNSKLP